MKAPDFIELQVLKRDNFSCKVCGKNLNLSVTPLIPTPEGFTPDGIPSVCRVTLCQTCSKRIAKQSQGGKFKKPDQEFEIHSKVYHAGVYRAQQFMNNLNLK